MIVVKEYMGPENILNKKAANCKIVDHIENCKP
jgi:hypothetical protein